MPNVSKTGYSHGLHLLPVVSTEAPVPTSTLHSDAALTPIGVLTSPVQIAYGSGSRRITGTVSSQSSPFTPVVRRVVAIDRVTGMIVADTLSTVSGTFELRVEDSEYVVVCLPDVDEAKNAEVFDRVYPVPAVVDPHYNNVKLLLHCDGVTGQTAVRDFSAASKTIVSNNVYVTTNDKKFGTGSLYCSGTSSYITTTTSLSDFVFGTGDFTIECWINTTDSNAVLIDFYSSGQYGWQVFLQPSGRVSFWVNVEVLVGNIAVNNGAWNHIAVVRSAGVTRLFVNGKIDVSITASIGNMSYQTGVLAVGAQVATRNPTYDYTGFIDEVRITKGVGRYTADFTPSVEAF